jgi:hypothetical protein
LRWHFWQACSADAIAQTGKPSGILLAESDAAHSDHEPDKRTVPLDAQQERQALRIFLKSVQIGIASAESYRFVEVDQVRPRRSDY